MYLDVPPCLANGEKINNCARSLYTWRVNAQGEMPGDWAGWRLAGRFLVSPDGDRISPGRLRGLLFQEYCRERLQKAQQPVLQGQVIAQDFARQIREILKTEIS